MEVSRKIFAALIAVCTIFSALSVEAKKSVAVLPLENISGYAQADVAQMLTEEITVILTNSGRYSIIERNQMAAILREQGFQNIAV